MDTSFCQIFLWQISSPSVYLLFSVPNVVILRKFFSSSLVIREIQMTNPKQSINTDNTKCLREGETIELSYAADGNVK